MPGFIDIHVHGGGGADAMDGTLDAFETIASTHARHGTTSFLLTTMTEDTERIERVLNVAKTFVGNGAGGAHMLGVHLEGPFIHPDKAGAHRLDAILEPDPELAERWFTSGIVRMMTLAPEQPRAHDVARIGRQYGVVMSAGHTMATTVDLEAALTAGFSHITHLCNAMRAFGHRDVGPIGHVIDNEAYTTDLICDGVHIHTPMLKALVRSIESDRLILISDAIRATDLSPGQYELGGQLVYVQDNVCRLENGTLAGSVLTMARAVSQIQRLAGVSQFTAQVMASTNPAIRLGLLSKGRISEGFDADLVAIDTTGHPLWTMVGGNVVFERG